MKILHPLNKVKLLLLILLLISKQSVFAQSWARIYYLPGGMVGYGVVEDSSKGFTIVGSRALLSANKIRMVQIDYLGDTTKMQDQCGFEGSAVVKDLEGGYFITGIASSCIPNVQYDLEVLHVDSNLNEIWKVAYGDAGIDKGKDLIYDENRGITVACYNTSTPDLLRLDSTGLIIWSQSYGLSGLYRIKRNLEGGYFICGNAGGGFVDPMYVAKIDSLGNVIWYKTFYTNITVFTDIEPTPDSGVVALTDVCELYKISASGDSLWKRSVYPGTNRIISTSDGHLAFTGAGALGMSLIKTDTAANVIWSRYFPYFSNPSPNSYSNGWDLIQTSDGGYLLVGEIDSLGTKNLYVVKTDSLGQVTTGLAEIGSSAQTHCYPQPFTEETIITFIAPDGRPISGPRTLEVFTTQGQKVRKETISTFPYHFHRNNLPSGIYVYTLAHPDEIPVSGKMVVR